MAIFGKTYWIRLFFFSQGCYWKEVPFWQMAQSLHGATWLQYLLHLCQFLETLVSSPQVLPPKRFWRWCSIDHPTLFIVLFWSPRKWVTSTFHEISDSAIDWWVYPKVIQVTVHEFTLESKINCVKCAMFKLLARLLRPSWQIRQCLDL